jgi:hypothetical protein
MRTVAILAFLMPFEVLAQEPIAAAAVADVDLKFVRVTDLPAAYICFDEEQKQCDVYAVYYLWEATLRQQNSGDALPKKFRVLFGNHALLREDFRLVGAHIIRSERLKTRKALYEITKVGDFEPLPNKSLERTRGR